MKEQLRSVWMKRVLKRLRAFSTAFGTGLKIPPPLAKGSCSILCYSPLLLIALAGLAHAITVAVGIDLALGLRRGRAGASGDVDEDEAGDG